MIRMQYYLFTASISFPLYYPNFIGFRFPNYGRASRSLTAQKLSVLEVAITKGLILFACMLSILNPHYANCRDNYGSLLSVMTYVLVLQRSQIEMNDLFPDPTVFWHVLRSWRQVGYLFGCRQQELWLCGRSLKGGHLWDVGLFLLPIKPPLFSHSKFYDVDGRYYGSIGTENVWLTRAGLYLFLQQAICSGSIFAWYLCYWGWEYQE